MKETCWTRPSISGAAPDARCAHTASFCGKIFIFGGWNGRRMLNDLHVLYPETMTWSTPITTGTVPGIRAGHTCTEVGTKLFFFGGGDGVVYLNDLHVLDTETMEWSQAFVAGTSPAARSRHTCTLVGNKLYVLGGGDDSRVYNDLYVLDLDTNTWERPEVTGEPPLPRWGHTATPVGKKIYVFGGHDGTSMLGHLYVLDTEKLRWSTVSASGTVPSARAGHTVVEQKGKLILFGGGDGKRICKDLYIFDPEVATFTQPQTTGAAPVARVAHSATLWEKKMVLFGGGDGSRRFKDLYMLSLEQVFKLETEAAKKKSRQKRAEETPRPITDVSSWLQSVGFGSYAESFVKEMISMQSLSLLTEEHLKALGVAPLGPRLQLLHFINTLPTTDASQGKSQQQHQQHQHQQQHQQQRRGVEPAGQRQREDELLQDGPLFGAMAMGSQLGGQLPIQRLVPLTLQADFAGVDEPMLQGPVRGWGVEQVAHWLSIQPYFRDYGNDVREKFLKEQINGLALLSLDDHQLSQMGFTVGLRNNLRHIIEQARSRDSVARAHQPSSPPRGAGLIPPFPMTMSSLNTVPPPVASPPQQQSVGSALSLMVDGSGDAGSYLGKRASSAISQEKKMHAYVELDAEAINQQSVFAILEPIMPPEGMRLSVTRKTSRKGGIAREKLTGILGQVVLLQRKSGEILDDISNVEGDLLVPGSHTLGTVKFRKWEVVNHCIRVVLRHVTVPCKEEHETVLQSADGPPKKKRARRETQTASLIFTITTNGGKHTVVLPLLMHHNNTTSVGPSTLHVQPGCVTINSATKEVTPPKVLIRGFHLNNSVLSWTAVPANPNLPTVTLPIVDVIQIKKTGVTGRESRLVEEAVEFDMPWEEQLPVGVSKDSLIVDGKPHMDHLTWTLVVDATPLASVAATQLSATYRLLPKPDETEVKWDPHSCWNRHLDVMFQ